MKKSIYYIIAAGVAALALAACNKEQGLHVETFGLKTESLRAVKGDETTKISMNGKTLVFGWVPGVDNASFTIYDGGAYSFVDSDFYGETEANKFTVNYSGTRQGFAVTPALFKGSYDGTDLYVNYPAEYDISARVDRGHYDDCYPSDIAFIRFPMVASSTSGDPNLTFYAIGALVKVVVNDVPKGTKNLYVTFNQKVTGSFLVSSPGTSTSVVSVSEPATHSTVKVKISEYGLTARHTITLYIPVPTASGLSIQTATTTKTTVARNKGYAFSCDAIARVDASTDFAYTDGYGSFNISFAPGNLYAYNNGGDVEYHFRSVRDQVKTTVGADDNDPHKDGITTKPSIDSPGNYKDIFTWDELYKIITGMAAPSSAADIGDATITVDGDNWRTISEEIAEGVISGKVRTRLNSIQVGCLNQVLGAFAQLDLQGSPYEGYTIYKSCGGMIGKDVVFGRFMFPDGYVDMTDLFDTSSTTPENYEKMTSCSFISYDTYEQMVDAGAVFLIDAGIYASGKYQETDAINIPYWLGIATSDTKAHILIGTLGKTYFKISSTPADRKSYRSVRLCKKTAAPNWQDIVSMPGFGNKDEVDW